MPALDRILPLKKLNKISIYSDHFHFVTLIKILYFLPSCSQLVLNSTLFDETDALAIQHTSTFKWPSNSNKITDITIKKMCTLKVVKLLVKLCPQLQHLMISVSHEQYSSTVDFLLSKTNENTRHLVTLRIHSNEDICLLNKRNPSQQLEQSKISVQILGFYARFMWWLDLY
jgi:hypothetical protein